jgi:hypothetical protein
MFRLDVLQHLEASDHSEGRTSEVVLADVGSLEELVGKPSEIEWCLKSVNVHTGI